MACLSSPSKTSAATLGLLLLLAVAMAPTIAAASNNKRTPMPAACLRAASSLCMGSSTNAMNCLKKLTKAGDSRVSQACTEALADSAAEQATANGAKPKTRLASLGRLLSEAPACYASASVTSSGTSVLIGYTCPQVCCKSAFNGACCAQVGSGAKCGGESLAQCA